MMFVSNPGFWNRGKNTVNKCGIEELSLKMFSEGCNRGTGSYVERNYEYKII